MTTLTCSLLVALWLVTHARFTTIRRFRAVFLTLALVWWYQTGWSPASMRSDEGRCFVWVSPYLVDAEAQARLLGVDLPPDACR